MDIEKKESNAKLNELDEIYMSFSKKKIWEEEYNKLIQENISLENFINNSELIIQEVNEYNTSIQNIIVKLNSKKSELRQNCDDRDKLSIALKEIAFTKIEYEAIIQEREYMTYMVEATSSKDGIPLEMVKSFIDDCKYLVNDLIRDIMDDDIEIEKFKIDDDFTIPYRKNGMLVSDVSKASQGQKSILMVAISFAFMEKCISMANVPIYNIPLLDEPDGSLYKSDKTKMFSMLMKHAKVIGSSQIFLITHSNNYNGQSVGVITTTDEIVNIDNVEYVINLAS